MKTFLLTFFALILITSFLHSRMEVSNEQSYRRAFNACIDADPSDAGICNCVDSLGLPEDMDTCLCGNVTIK